MNIAPGQGQTTPWEQFLMSTESPYHFAHCCRFKKIALKSDFIYIIFMFHHMYIAPGKGRQSIGDKIFMITERPFLFADMLLVSK